MMNKQLLRTMLLLFALIAGSGSVWAETKSVDITPSQALNDGGVDPISIVCAKGDGTSIPAISGGQLRLYQAGKGKTTGNTITFSSGKTITSIVFTFANSMTADNGSFNVGTYDSETSTWTGSATSITLTVTGTSSSERIYITAIKVYYEDDTTPSPGVPSIAIDETLNVDAAEHEGALTVTYNEIDFTVTPEVVFYESDGVTQTTYSWIEASVNATSHNVDYLIEENTGNASRTAYMKVYGLDEEFNDVYSNLITITQANPVVATQYRLATAITPGKHYILVGAKNGSYYAMGSQNQNNRTGVAITVTDGLATVTDDLGVYEVRINGDLSTGYYTIYDEKTPGYLYAASGTGTGNYMKTEKELDANGNGTWEMRVTNEGVASIKAISDANRPWMRYNSGSTLFSCYQYSDSQSDIYLFERVGDESTQSAPVEITAAGYATFATKFAVDFSATSLEVYTAQVNDAKNGVVLNEVASKKVPAGAAVILKGATAAGTVIAEADALADNDLEAGPVTGDGESHYVLGKEGDKVGFGLLVVDTELAANKAYIAASKFATNAPAFMPFSVGETTGINSVKGSEFMVNGSGIFNLAGQRVKNPSNACHTSTFRLKKGLYIVNGRKVVIK